MQRRSKQRETILEVLRGTKTHPSAEWVYKEVKKVIPNISLGTVYRNLKLLHSKGEIIEIACSGEEGRFDGNPDLHYHITCIKCGKIGDVEDFVLKEIEGIVAETTGFKILNHCVGFTGICPECKENSKKLEARSKM
ncbi:MAG: transcriptional repressor [Nitrospirae bacterium]|nr:transcriptional repressor [Nitrospirota bacterium]